MQIKEIISAIEKTAPLSGQAHWDKSGMQVTRDGSEISSMTVFLDPTPEAIKLAAKNSEFLLAHHPLSLNPELPCHHNNWYFSLKTLFNANVCLYSAHTSLDVNLAGPSGWLGRMLGLENMRPLEPCPENPSWGFGGIGELPVARFFDEVAEETLKLAKCEEAMLCGKLPKKRIQRIAWCGGSGGSLIPLARDAGADLFITGDIKHHAAIDASISVLDVGHHSLEEEMMRRFGNLLREQLPEIKIEFLPSASPFTRIYAGE